MATNEFTPTGGSPRATDDSDGIKGAIAAAMAAHDEDVDDVESDETAKVAETEKEATEVEKKTEDAVKPEQDSDKKSGAKAAAPDDTKAADKKPADDGDKSVEPPSSWSAKDKELFAKQTPEAKAFLLDRHKSMEADYTRKTQDLATQRKEYEAVDQVFAPHRDKLKAANLTPSQVIQGWAAAEQRLMNGDGLNLIPALAKNYNLDPIKLATQILIVGGVADPKAAMEQIAASAAEQVKAQPQPIQLPPEVTARLAIVDRVAAHVDSQERAQAEAEVARIYSSLETFKTATDASGALLHPHFDELIDTISKLADQAKAAKQPIPPIDQLYQDAIFANPAVRQKWLDAKLAAERSSTVAAQQAAREKAAAEARAKSEKARKAGSSVTGAAGTGQPLNGRSRGSDNLRSALEAAVEDQDQVVH
jgi:hypothetical protein